MTTATYKYAHAHDWLRQHLTTIEDAELLRQIVMHLALKNDSDVIQDLFEREMDADGYFTPIEGDDDENH